VALAATTPMVRQELGSKKDRFPVGWLAAAVAALVATAALATSGCEHGEPDPIDDDADGDGLTDDPPTDDPPADDHAPDNAPPVLEPTTVYAASKTVTTYTTYDVGDGDCTKCNSTTPDEFAAAFIEMTSMAAGERWYLHAETRLDSLTSHKIMHSSKIVCTDTPAGNTSPAGYPAERIAGQAWSGRNYVKGAPINAASSSTTIRYVFEAPAAGTYWCWLRL
jgi:hypothetical protein